MDEQNKKTPRGYIDGIPVWCAFDKIVPIGEIKPNAKNPNQHPDEQIQLLGRIIREAGWRRPITVSTLSGLVVKGHGRLLSAQLEGFSMVPVEYQHYDSMAAEEADLVADNRIAELAEIDNKMLADIFADIDTGEIPLEMTGFTEKEVESLITGLAEALHKDDEEETDDVTDETEDPEEGSTADGDQWECGSISKNDAVFLLLDAKTGKTVGIRLFKEGEEQGREVFESLLSE